MSGIVNNNLAANNFPAGRKDAAIESRMWSVGGGKGGTGKSFVTLSLGIRLAMMKKRVVIIDADLGGANLHTLLGIRNPQYTLNDFIKKRVDSLNEVCIETQIPNLKLISGGDDILSLSNPKYSQKAKILRHLHKLEADYILLDLGAGTSYNVLDFFLYTQGKMLVVSPFPTSIQNAYGFIKTALYRRLSQLFSKNDRVTGLINKSIDPGRGDTIKSVVELMAAVEEVDQESAFIMSREIENFNIKLVVNMVKSEEDRRVGDIIKTVSDKYLGIDVNVLSSVPFDLRVEKSIILANPLLLNENGNEATMSIYEIAMAILKTP
jgi:flagellar biosynthesis protein FlhG